MSREDIVAEIAAERARQVNVEGWSPSHDAAHHSDESLALVAALYASPIDLYDIRSDRFSMRAVDPWPWKSTRYGAGRGDDFVDLSYQVNDGDKRAKHDRRKRLVIAAAFIVAELGRLDSAAKVSQQQGSDATGSPQAPVAQDSEAISNG